MDFFLKRTKLSKGFESAHFYNFCQVLSVQIDFDDLDLQCHKSVGKVVCCMHFLGNLVSDQIKIWYVNLSINGQNHADCEFLLAWRVSKGRIFWIAKKMQRWLLASLHWDWSEQQVRFFFLLFFLPVSRLSVCTAYLFVSHLAASYFV